MGPVHYLYLSFPKDVYTVSLGGIELLLGWSYFLDDRSHVSNMLAVVSFGERKVFLGGLGGWCKMCLVLFSRYVGGVEVRRKLTYVGPGQQSAVIRHMRWWNAGNESAQKSKLFAAEAEARRLYDGVRWLRGSRTRSELASDVMPFLRNSEEILPRLRLSEAVPCLKEIYP